MQYRGEIGILGPMARQTGLLKIIGTVDALCFYQMEGQYYARKKSSLTGKRFRNDAAFAGSRRSAGLLQQASPLASRLYQLLPKEKRGRPVYQGLVGKVKLLLQAGQTEAAIHGWFETHYLTKKLPKTARKLPVSPTQRLLKLPHYRQSPLNFPLRRLPQPHLLQQPMRMLVPPSETRNKNKNDFLTPEPILLYT